MFHTLMYALCVKSYRNKYLKKRPYYLRERKPITFHANETHPNPAVSHRADCSERQRVRPEEQVQRQRLQSPEGSRGSSGGERRGQGPGSAGQTDRADTGQH